MVAPVGCYAKKCGRGLGPPGRNRAGSNKVILVCCDLHSHLFPLRPRRHDNDNDNDNDSSGTQAAA